MNFSNLRWADAGHRTMYATIDNGEVILLNADVGLSHYDAIVASGAPIAAYIPAEISSRQFWMQMANANLIDESDAVKALGGDIPNVIKQFIQTLPVLQRFSARMFFEASTFERHKRAADDLKACFAINDAAIDLFFQQAAAL